MILKTNPESRDDSGAFEGFTKHVPFWQVEEIMVTKRKKKAQRAMHRLLLHPFLIATSDHRR